MTKYDYYKSKINELKTYEEKMDFLDEIESILNLIDRWSQENYEQIDAVMQLKDELKEKRNGNKDWIMEETKQEREQLL